MNNLIKFGLAWLLCFPFVGWAADSSSLAAGKISFVIGKVYITRAEADGGSEESFKAKPNTEVFAGDQIKTLSGGHAHIRFVDHAMVSVRPNSQLNIDYYHYDANNPAVSIIRFDLVEGRVRSISGKGAKANREKFRLNTPIAAIGVRGTDFVVSADNSLVQAIVNEGAIVVAPFSESCAMDGVSRCDVNGVELRGDSRHIVEFSEALGRPRLVPIEDKFIPELMDKEPGPMSSSESSDMDDSQASSTSSQSVEGDGAEEQGGEQLGEIIEDMSDISTESELLKNDPDDSRLLPTEPEPIPEPVKPNDYTPEIALSTEELNQRKLVWGRWTTGTEETDRIVAVRIPEVTDGRSVAVGNSQFVLYRTDSELSELQSGLGQVEFDLVDAQATLTTSTSTDRMQVKDGWLNVDFGRMSFATGMKLNHFLATDIQFSMSGNINDKGYFNSRENGILIGATTLDGNEASYFFSHEHELGLIEGLTHWQSSPEIVQ